MSQYLDPAKKSLYQLIRHVYCSLGELKGVTYQELALRIGRLNKHGEGHAHGMGKVLGDMGHLLQDLEGEWGEPIPPIQCLVVNKSGQYRGLPDEGIKEFWPGYPMLSKEEKLNMVRREYANIVDFGSRWNKVLLEMGLEPVEPDPGNDPSIKRKYGRGGESPEHVALKNHILANPGLVGANTNDEGFIEYPFPSLDTVDVLFKSNGRWIAVEVKSRISDQIEKDYERGLYQCVKYRSLLEAMQKDERYDVPDSIQVKLVLEKSLPEKYRITAKSLDVVVIDDVAV
ncbi:MAG: hypothetical protein ACE5FQ_14135 [Thiogranum sp.]